MENIQAQLQKRQNKFIETRTIIADQVNKYIASLAILSEEQKQQCIMPNGSRAEEVLPELWNEPFNEEVYNMQLMQLQKSIVSVTALRDRLNQEAMACLQQSE